MIRRLPIIPTIVVVAAAATMVVLGFWQLGRMDEKAALIAKYASAGAMTSEVPWPRPEQYESNYFRAASIDCRKVRGIDSVSGRSSRGASGWAYIARCEYDGEGTADVAIGWSRDPNPLGWEGGTVKGVIAPYHNGIKLVATEPVAGLELLARPDPSDLPNNHLAYAGQWFFFALTALGIYWLAVRKRLARPAGEG